MGSSARESDPALIVRDWRPAWWHQLSERAPPYVLVRFVMLRLLAAVYLVAFLVTARQGVPLIGEAGLLPVPAFLHRVTLAAGSEAAAFVRLPTLFWFGYSDTALSIVAWLGVALSLGVLAGVTNAAVQGALWILYLSIAQVGQRFYGFGWESQLLETGFLSIFLCPLRSIRPDTRAPPFVVILLFRYLIWRIMLGAGLIKIRGDECWRNLTCLVSHYETQPIPNPLSPFFHFAPAWVHKLGVVFNHLVELVAPWFAFGPRRARLIAGILFVLFQITLILSGNLSFLNWLTLVPAIACFDDAALRRLIPSRWRERISERRLEASPLHYRAAWAYAFVVLLLSLNPVSNLLSSRQAMNLSFDPLRLVNTYGAFGSVSKQRYEVVVEGTRASRLDARTEWKEYEFPCKPGTVTRAPCWISPYHLRLDWQMWFAALGNPAREPWFVHLVYQLLSGDRDVTGLLSKNPFPDEPPRHVRAEFYRYEMVSPLKGDPRWWHRTRVGTYLRPVSREDPELRAFLARFGWTP